MLGRVLWYNGEKETGEILSKDQQRFFFTAEDCIFKKRSKISEGIVVEFSVSTASLFGKPRAQNILASQKKIKKQSDSQMRLPDLDGEI